VIAAEKKGRHSREKGIRKEKSKWIHSADNAADEKHQHHDLRDQKEDKPTAMAPPRIPAAPQRSTRFVFQLRQHKSAGRANLGVRIDGGMTVRTFADFSTGFLVSASIFTIEKGELIVF